MKIEVHIVAWNEMETIALTIKHYQKFCDKIILHDNFSDDNTREIAESMGCDVKLFGIKGVLDDREYTKLKNNVWKGSDADWVIVVDADEILDTDRETLDELRRLHFGMISTYGWQVVSNEMPKEDWLEIKTGYHYENYSKFCIFNPNVVKEINYIHGCHECKPVGEFCTTNENARLTLFHYRNVGGPERLVKRHAMYRERMSEWNKRWGCGSHYQYEDSQRRKEWEDQHARSVEFSLLGTG